MPTISYFICPQLAWFSLSVKICMEWFIRLYSWTSTAQPVGLVEKKILILNSILSKTLTYSWLLAGGIQTALQGGKDLPHHLFPSAHLLSRTGLPAPLSRGNRTTPLHLPAVPFSAYPLLWPRQDGLLPLLHEQTWLKLLANTSAYLWRALSC